jgi:hypothetical protein
MTISEKSDIMSEFYPKGTRAVAIENRIASYDISGTVSQGYVSEWNNVGDFLKGISIIGTNYIATCHSDQNGPAFQRIYIYEHGASMYLRYYDMADYSGSISSKFGTPYLITTQYSGTTATREIFNRVT